MEKKKGRIDANAVMRRGKAAFINGEALMKVKDAAKIAGLHEAVLAMAQRLLADPSLGGVWELGTPELKLHADGIKAKFLSGLRKVAKVLGPGGLNAKALRDGDRLVFWYEGADTRTSRRRASSA